MSQVPDLPSAAADPSLPADIAGAPAQWWLRLGHDLRGPIAPMRMAVQMLRGGWVGPSEQEEALRMIDRQIDALLGSIEDVGELLRLHAGTFVFAAQDADLSALLDQVGQRSGLQRWLQERQRQLQVELPSQPVLARHDPQRLGRLLEFLVRRAAIHSAPGASLVLSLWPGEGRVHWRLTGSGPSLAKDPELRLVAGETEDLEECEPQALVVREVARRHDLQFTPLAAGEVGFSMAASA